MNRKQNTLTGITAINAVIFALALALAATACDNGNNGTTDNDKTTKFEGTWNKQGSSDDFQLIFNKNDFLFNVGYYRNPRYKGTFSFTENEFQLSITHQWDNEWVVLSISATYQYTFLDDNTVVFANDDYPNDSIIGTWKKLSAVCDCLEQYGTLAHLGIGETCCNGDPCPCTEQADEHYNIPLRKTAGVTAAQFRATAALVKAAMDADRFDNKDLWRVNGLTAIHIVPGNAVGFQGGIMTVGADPEYPATSPITGEEAKYRAIGRQLAEIFNIII